MNDINKELKNFVLSLGVDLFGVADVVSIKDKFLLSNEAKNNFNRAISIGIVVASGVLDDIDGQPTRLYYQYYRTLNNLLDQIGVRIASFIEKRGFKALPIPASQVFDGDRLNSHLSHKEIGVLAGLGWIGRNNLLVNEIYGSQFRLATVLTNLDLICARPLEKDCGECYDCISACPASALGEDSRDYNLNNCFLKLKEFQKKRIVDQMICGICVKSCKPSKNKN
ncbi:MAG: hypothetical protein AB1755_05675 [Candidatus Omnitrophota bacterium]